MSGKSRVVVAALASAAFGGILAPGWAYAQQSATPAQGAEDADPDAIIVTAQKRAETLQNVPLSITAFSDQAIERTGINEFRDYAVRTPNIAFSYSNSIGANAQSIAIRGVFGANTTGLYLDEVPLPESVDPRVLDVERIEVLRGPQGTLFGARSMGGTVRLITKQPDATELSGQVHGIGSLVKEGGWNGSADVGINVPVVKDQLALRASLFYDRQSGVFDRVASAGAPTNFGINKNVDGSRQYGGQVSARLTLADQKLALTPRFAFANGDTYGKSYADIAPGNFTQSRLFDINEPGFNNWRLYSLTGQYEAEFGTFVSSTSKFTRKLGDSEDFSEFAVFAFGVPPVRSIIRAHIDSDAFAQELRFVSNFRGPLEVTLGGFYQKTDGTLVFPATAVGDIIDNIFRQRLRTQVEEAALFGEARITLTDALSFTAGARWFDNKVIFDGEQDGLAVSADSFAGTQHERDINPKFELEYKASRDALIYAQASKGFRIGGVNSFSNLLCAPDLAALGVTAAQAQSFDSDSLWSYEVGAKTQWADRRLTINAAAYKIDWSNLQQLVPLQTCGFNLTLNAGAATIKGFEVETKWRVTDSLTVSGGLGRTDSEVTSAGNFGASIPTGVPVQQVPDWTYTAALDYQFGLAGNQGYIHVDYSHVGASSSANNSSVNRRIRPAYGIANARLGLEMDHVSFALFADNVFNEKANLSDVPPLAIELPGRPRIATNRPLTVGVEARVKF